MLEVDNWRPAEALTEARRAVVLDPLSPTAHAELARAYLAADRCDDAFAQLHVIDKLRPPLLRAASIASQCDARKQLWPQAVADARRSQAGQSGSSGLLGYMLARAGRLNEARHLLDSLGA